jgi:two-component system chemotaxis response regulator CheY
MMEDCMASKVLVVDDSMMVRQQVKRALTVADFSVVEAQDGMDALEKLSANPDVALVVCDVNMPRMGGMDFLEALRKLPTFGALPVVMLTTEAQPELVARAKTFGAKGWIIKPFKPELLLAAAKKLAVAKAA